MDSCGDGSSEQCFQCDTGKERYHRDFMCDGVKDCPDGTDERECPGLLKLLLVKLVSALINNSCERQ